VIVDEPAERACMRVLLGDETNTTAAAEEMRLDQLVTSYAPEESVRDAVTFAVAWK
jgi:hypothetical protein